MHCDQLLVWNIYFCIFYIYIHRVLNFKICFSFPKCQTLNKYLPVPVTLCCLCCPLWPFGWTDFSWGRGHLALPALWFQGDLPSKADPAKGQKSWTLAWRGEKAGLSSGNPESLLLSVQVWLFWPLGSVLVRLNENIYYTWKLFAEGVGEAKSRHY